MNGNSVIKDRMESATLQYSVDPIGPNSFKCGTNLSAKFHDRSLNFWKEMLFHLRRTISAPTMIRNELYKKKRNTKPGVYESTCTPWLSAVVVIIILLFYRSPFPFPTIICTRGRWSLANKSWLTYSFHHSIVGFYHIFNKTDLTILRVYFHSQCIVINGYRFCLVPPEHQGEMFCLRPLTCARREWDRNTQFMLVFEWGILYASLTMHIFWMSKHG